LIIVDAVIVVGVNVLLGESLILAVICAAVFNVIDLFGLAAEVM
jgi:hypothetical protein